MALYLVFALALFNVGGFFAARMLLALYALKLGAQPLAVGLLAATFSAAPTLLSWVGGRLSDRFGARIPIMASTAIAVAGMSVPYFVPALPALFVAAALCGLSFTFYNVCAQNLVGSLSRQHTRTRNYGNLTLAGSCGALVAPIATGYSIDHSGPALTCLFLGLVWAMPLLALMIWGRVLPGAARSAPPSGSVREVLLAPGLLRVLATSSLVVVGMDLFQFYMPIYGHAISLPASTIGVVLSMLSAASVVVRVAMPWLLRWVTEEKLLAYSFYMGAAAFVLLPFFENGTALAVIAFVFGLGMGCGAPITMMLAFSQSSAGRSGEALGLRLTVNHLTRVIGPVLFGSIGSAFGLFPVFWGNACMLALGGIISRKKRRAGQ